MSYRAALVGVLAGAAIVLVAFASLPVQATTPVRTLYVVRSSGSLPNTQFVRTRDCIGRPRTCVNGVGGLELVYLVRGKMPRRATSATVLTDTNCAPDAYGVSHCLNALRLVSGRRIVVRHDHSMMNDPCLVPGERVRVRSLR